MKEFVYGTATQFAALDRELSSGKKYKFANRQLPPSCRPGTADLWFAKIDGTYCLYIDKGITTSADHADFKQFLECGVTKFICMDDLIAFFRALKPLFGSADETAPRPKSEFPVRQSEPSTADVLDKQKLKTIQAAETKSKMVWPDEIAAPLKKKVFGQDKAIDALADKVVINQMRKTKKTSGDGAGGPDSNGKIRDRKIPCRGHVPHLRYALRFY